MHSLKPSLLVCDGGAPNLAALKATHGYFGAYGINMNSIQDPHVVKPWFVNYFNPFNPPHRIFWLICPTHQVRE